MNFPQFLRFASILLVLSATAVAAQEQYTENTLKLGPGAKSPAATISEISWLAGHWRAEALGGIAEELWSQPTGDAMMGMFRLVRDGKVVFYEFLTIMEENGSLMHRLKHFHSDLKGWEEKEKTVDFPLVAKSASTFQFEGLTMRKDSDTSMTLFVALKQKDGEVKEEVFRYTRVATKDHQD